MKRLFTLLCARAYCDFSTSVGVLWCSRMTRDELASDGINGAGDTREIGTDTHSQSGTN
jgi:hypothetical protein